MLHWCSNCWELRNQCPNNDLSTALDCQGFKDRESFEQEYPGYDSPEQVLRELYPDDYDRLKNYQYYRG